MMKKILLFVFTLGVVLGLSAPPGYSASLTLAPEIDTYINKASAGTSYGTSDFLFAGKGASSISIYRSFLKFNLSEMPDNSIITNATLELYCSYTTGSGNYYYELHHVADNNVVTNGLTWNTRPTTPEIGPYLDRELISFGTTGLKTWSLLESGIWDFATDLSDDLVSVQLIRSLEYYPGQLAGFRSLEYGGTTYDPRLVIDYTPVPIPTTIFLLGSCLIGLAGVRKKLKK